MSVLTATLACNAKADAAWFVSPQVAVQSLHNTNPYLLHRPERSMTTDRLDLNLPLMGESELFDLSLAPQFHFIQTRNRDDLDRNEYSLGAGASRRMSLGDAGFNGDYISDTTLTSAFLDTGYTGVNKQRTVQSLEPYLNWQWAAKSSLMTSLKYQKQDYKDAALTPLTGYEYAQANVTLIHEIDDQDVLKCGLDRSKMQSPRVDSDKTGVQCSVVREIAEPLNGSLTLGQYRVSSAGVFETRAQHGALAALDLTYQTMNIRYGLRGSRSVEPGGYGLLVRTDQLEVNAAYSINDAVWTRASITANRYEMTTSAYALPDRDYAVAQWNVAWQYLPEWIFEVGINNARQRYDFETSSASSTTLLVQLAYHSQRY